MDTLLDESRWTRSVGHEHAACRQWVHQLARLAPRLARQRGAAESRDRPGRALAAEAQLPDLVLVRRLWGHARLRARRWDRGDRGLRYGMDGDPSDQRIPLRARRRLRQSARLPS